MSAEKNYWVIDGHNLPPKVENLEIGLTDLPKYDHGTPGTPRDDTPVMYSTHNIWLSNIIYEVRNHPRLPIVSKEKLLI